MLKNNIDLHKKEEDYTEEKNDGNNNNEDDRNGWITHRHYTTNNLINMFEVQLSMYEIHYNNIIILLVV